MPDSTSAASAFESIEYFTINNNKKMFVGNRTWYSFFTELPINQIIPKGVNKLKVFKIKDKLYYFINNVYNYRSEIEAKQDGFHFGFMVPAKGSVYLENLTVSKSTSASVASKILESNPVKFEIKEAKSLNQFKILSK